MGTHAVVVGGSLAGLSAGRVLAGFFDRVTIVERDALPEGVADRAGVPQSRQYHYLMLRGRREFDRLFPGLDTMLQRRGAPEREVGVNVAVLSPIGWSRPRREFRLPGIQPTRALIESSVRELFLKLPRVEILQRTEVAGLTAANINGSMRCTGVEMRSRDGGAHSGALAADLVVDASGGTSRAGAWLEKIGLEAPAETIVDGDYGYSSRWYRMRDGAKWPHDWWWTMGANLGPEPPEHMIVTILTQYESGRWSLSLAGLNGNYPPDDDAGLAEFIPRVRSPVIAEMLKLMEPTSAFYTSRATRNRWRHYERWGARLGGFLAIGDAAAVYNPTAGQGMSVVALTANVLRECIEKFGASSPELGPRFFAAQAAAQRDPWRIAVGNDLRLPATAGERPWAIRWLNWYRDRVAGAASDPAVRDQLEDVFQMIKPVSALYEPAIVRRVMLATIRDALRRGRKAAPSPMPPPMPD
jgi:2-polyprenyl-6-methoxyphenol hydroxylase-like FAD-dependent oxidoreductase